MTAASGKEVRGHRFTSSPSRTAARDPMALDLCIADRAPMNSDLPIVNTAVSGDEPS
jgi:hypothetical protein